MRFAITVVMAVTLAGPRDLDPYERLTPAEQTVLKPQVERWIRDQAHHDWSDLWEIQDQTRETKNALLLANRDAPDLDRHRFVEAMQSTIGIGEPEIKAFKVLEVDRESGGFQVRGCAKRKREEWQSTGVIDVHVRVVADKLLFGWPDPASEKCRL